MSDRIFIEGLALHAYHGVMAHEAKVGQTFTIDMVLDIDLSASARSDKVRDTVSYDRIVAVASDVFCKKRYKLIEAAGGAVADEVLVKFPLIKAVEVTIHKPHAPIAATFADVGIVLKRTRR